MTKKQYLEKKMKELLNKIGELNNKHQDKLFTKEE